MIEPLDARNDRRPPLVRGTLHRADYIRERGVWRATCRECGWNTADLDRRQAATLFRSHIQDMRDLGVPDPPDPSQPDAEQPHIGNPSLT